MTRGWADRAAAWIIRRAAKWAPEKIGRRLEEEWLGDLGVYAAGMARLRFALGCFWAAIAVRYDKSGVRNAPITQFTLSNLRERPNHWRWPGLKFAFHKRRDRIREEAFVWLERLRRGLKDQEGTALQAWLKQRSHRACVARAALERDGEEGLSILSQIFWVKPEWLETVQRRNLAMNASFALIAMAIVSVLFFRLIAPPGSYVEAMGTAYTSDRQLLRRVGLSDGTQMVLNRGTRVSVWYYDDFRAAMLTRGEATFTVRHEISRIFTLDAGDRHLSTTGGTFDVRLSDRALELTVLDGVVSISGPSAAEGRRGKVGFGIPTVLKADETIGIAPGKQSARTLSQLEAQAKIAWQRG